MRETSGFVKGPTFAVVPDWVVTHPGIIAKPPALLVYAHLCLMGNFKTRITTSDWREITKATGFSKPTVMRAMKVLREVKAVERRGDDLYLPKDEPGVKYETGDSERSQIRDKSGSDLRLAPLLTENSEKDVEADAPTPEIILLCKLLADRYAQFAGLPPANYQTKSWTNAMRLLLERGPTGRPAEPLSVEIIRRRIDGIFDHLADPGSSGFCWAAQIRSPLGLRKHWDQITVVSKARGHDHVDDGFWTDAHGNLRVV